jgi:hypothetical protein
LKKETQQNTEYQGPVVEKRLVVNMNYPPAELPMKELERFLGEPGEEDRNLLDNIKVRKNRGKKPSPV